MQKTNLSSSDCNVIEIEQTSLINITRAILDSTADSSVNPSQYNHFYQLRDEISTAKTEDLPNLFSMLHTTKQTLEIDKNTDLPDIQQPYFAHMRLKTRGKIQDIMLGNQTFIGTEISGTIIDWRKAPLSKIFFIYREGEEYEEEINGRTLEGLILMRNILIIDKGILVEISTDNRVLHRITNNQWKRFETSFIPRLSGGSGKSVSQQIMGTRNTGYKSPVISALLDPEQFKIMTKNEGQPLLILGGAGSGKTTAALHRLAHASYQEQRLSQLEKMLVILPEKGLVKLTKLLLTEMGVPKIKVLSFADWVKQQTENIMRDLPKRICKETPYSIIRLKKHPAILKLLPLYLKKVEQDIMGRIKNRFPRNPEWVKNFISNQDQPLLKRLLNTKENALNNIKTPSDKPKALAKQLILRFFDEEIELLFDLNSDRLALFTDKTLLTKLINEIKKDTNEELISDVIQRTSLQHLPTSPESYHDYEQDRLLMADGKSILNNDSDELAGSIDQEDFPILFELLRLKTGEYRIGEKSLSTYTHLLIDETQDFSPLELSLLKGTITKKTTITVAGDSMQQIDPTAYFDDWQTVLTRLGITGTAPLQLKTIYRSPKPIADFAHKVLGPIAPSISPNTVRDGMPVLFNHYLNQGLAITALVDTLENLTQNEPMANIVIITRNVSQAKKLYPILHDILNLQLVLDGEFSFKQGIELTEVSQVKGLEFDYVIIPDASEKNYPNSLESRRLMHVAATRAIHQLWVLWTGNKSSIIPVIFSD